MSEYDFISDLKYTSVLKNTKTISGFVPYSHFYQILREMYL